MSSRVRFLLLAVAATTVAACLGGTPVTSSTGPYYTIALYGGTPDSIALPASSPTTVRVQIKHAGTATPGVPMVWTAKGGNSRVVNPAIATDTLGVATATWVVSDTVGTDSLTVATVDGSATLTLHARVVAGAVSSVVRLTPSPDTVAAGTAVQLGVKTTDRTGNAVPNVTVSWTATSGTLSAGTSATDTSGVASVNFTPSSRGTFTVTAVLPNATSLIFTIVAT